MALKIAKLTLANLASTLKFYSSQGMLSQKSYLSFFYTFLTWSIRIIFKRFTGIVLYYDNKIAGCATAVIVGSEAHIYNLIIAKALRKKGLSKIVMNAFLKSLFDDFGVDHIIVDVIEGNLAALRLYENHGFKKQSVLLTLYLQHPDTAVTD